MPRSTKLTKRVEYSLEVTLPYSDIVDIPDTGVSLLHGSYNQLYSQDAMLASALITKCRWSLYFTVISRLPFSTMKTTST